MNLFVAVALSILEIITAFTYTGGITFYYGEFEGRPLYCGGTYDEETGPWLAVTVEWYESGLVECGDRFLILFSDGTQMVARARDAGHLSSYTVWDTGLPIIADLPRYWREGRETATGTIVNLSAISRALAAQREGGYEPVHGFVESGAE